MSKTDDEDDVPDYQYLPVPSHDQFDRQTLYGWHYTPLTDEQAAKMQAAFDRLDAVVDFEYEIPSE